MVHVSFSVSVCSIAELESLLTSPLTNALPNVLKRCVNDEVDVLELVLEVIGILVENGWFIGHNLC